MKKPNIQIDSDKDGLPDIYEINTYKTNPNNPDTDGDGLNDGDEIKTGHNPLIKDYFIPNKSNNYRPYALKPQRLLFYGLSILIVKFIVVITATLLPLTAFLTSDYLAQESQKIISLTNEIRQNLNVDELTENFKLTQAAMSKAQDMAVKQYFAHTGPDGRKVSDWLKSVNYNYRFGGENLAMGFSTAQDIVNAWENSPTHYKNMIDPDFKEIGVAMSSGVYSGYDTTFAVQYFGTEKTVQLNSKPVEENPNQTQLNQETPNTQEQESLEVPTSTQNITNNIETPTTTIKNVSNENVLAEKEVVPEQKRVIINDVNKNTTTTEIQKDTQAPQIINPEKTQIDLSKDSSGNYVVSVEIYLSSDTKTASVFIKNIEIKLIKDDTEDNKWSASLITDDKELFEPTVPLSLEATDDSGNQLTTDLDWTKIAPIKSSVINQYCFLKTHKNNPLNSLFNISSIYFKILLAIAIVLLLINIFVEIKKQYLDIILSSLLLIILIIILIIF